MLSNKTIPWNDFEIKTGSISTEKHIVQEICSR
jgi:hypothetical protein